MNHLVLIQQNNERGTCACVLNGKCIDQCDMNYIEKYTQAHIVLANCMRSLRDRDIRLTIIPHNNAPGYYSDKEIKDMANILIGTDFVDLFGLTRIYRL